MKLFDQVDFFVDLGDACKRGGVNINGFEIINAMVLTIRGELDFGPFVVRWKQEKAGEPMFYEVVIR